MREGGRPVGQRVQVSSLTGSCPYLAEVAPSDRLKVGADTGCIPDYSLFNFLSCSTQWPVIGSRAFEECTHFFKIPHIWII